MSIHCAEMDRIEDMLVFSQRMGDGIEDRWRARLLDHLREGHDGERCPDPENHIE